MSTGEKIRILRKSKGKTQEELAYDLVVSRQTINKWETDKAQPSIDNIKRLCAIFEVGADYFIETDGAISNEQHIDTIETTTKGNNKHIALIICSVIDGILFLISVLWTVVFGFAAFSTNTGDSPVGSDSIDSSEFVIMLVLSIAFLVIEILLFVKILKNRHSTTTIDKNINLK